MFWIAHQMTTRSDLESELTSRLQVASNSTLFPSARITSLIKNAYMWATQLFVWHDLVRALKTNTVASAEYYEYPDEFRSESIIRLEIDDVEYKRKNFEDYLAYKRANTTTTKKMFASFGRQFFINPTPSSTGTTYNMSVWGAIQADELTASSSVPIFSKNKQEGNEAVVKKALSVALFRSSPQVAREEEAGAILILSKLSMDEQRNTQRNKRLDHPMLNVPDFFGGNNSTSPTGSFNYNTEEDD